MDIARKMKRRSGFTLVELCVVIAIAAIVGTMIVTFSLFLFNQNEQIMRNASRISEITKTQTVINDWIRIYDQQIYDIRPNDDQTKLIAYKNDEQVSTLYLDNGIIYAGGTEKNEKFSDITSIYFSKISSETQKLIQADLYFKEEGDEKQVLIFAVYSGMTRDRNVMGRNG